MQVLDQIENKEPRFRGVLRGGNLHRLKIFTTNNHYFNGVKTRRADMPVLLIYIVMQILIIP